jgi:hypothetical protein
VPAYGYGAGIGFEYRSKHLHIGGYLHRGYLSGGYVAGPYYPVYGGYGYPYAAVRKNVTINIYTPPNIIVAPGQDYDVSGVDLDLVRPEQVFGKTMKMNGLIEPEPKPPVAPPAAAPALPGKDVSVPKQPVRPGDMPAPPGPKVGPGPAGAEFPRPAPPLPNARDEADRLVQLGLEEFKIKEFGLAAHYFKKASRIDPSHFLARVLLAQAHLAFGRYQQGYGAVLQAIQLNKEYPHIKFRPRLSLHEGMEPEFEAQLDALRDAVTQNPNAPELLFLLAHQLWFDEQRAAAVEFFRAARPLSPDPAAVDLFLNAGKPKVVAAK